MSKGNPNHDPHSGEFSSGGGGGHVKIGKFEKKSGEFGRGKKHVVIGKFEKEPKHRGGRASQAKKDGTLPGHAKTAKVHHKPGGNAYGSRHHGGIGVGGGAG